MSHRLADDCWMLSRRLSSVRRKNEGVWLMKRAGASQASVPHVDDACRSVQSKRGTEHYGSVDHIGLQFSIEKYYGADRNT